MNISRIRASGDIIRKIEVAHSVPMAEVYQNLASPERLVSVELQESRRIHDETYRLYFQLGKKKRLKIVITLKTLKKRIYIVTAHYMRARTDKLIKPVRRRMR